MKVFNLGAQVPQLECQRRHWKQVNFNFVWKFLFEPHENQAKRCTFFVKITEKEDEIWSNVIGWRRHIGICVKDVYSIHKSYEIISIDLVLCKKISTSCLLVMICFHGSFIVTRKWYHFSHPFSWFIFFLRSKNASQFPARNNLLLLVCFCFLYKFTEYNK